MAAHDKDERKTVLVDMDGVLCDYSATMARKLNKKWGLDLTADSFPAWRDANKLNRQRHLDMQRSDGLYLELEPVDGAIEAIKTMMTTYNVFFVSSPCCGGTTCHSNKHQWIIKYIGMRASKQLILTKDKTMIRGDVLIDDRIQPGLMSPTWKHVLLLGTMCRVASIYERLAHKYVAFEPMRINIYLLVAME